MQLLIFVLGALLIALAVRLWRGLPWPTLLAYLGLVLVFFARPLLTRAIQVPTDIAYQWRPWNESAPRPLVVQNGLLSDIALQMLPLRSLVRERWLALSPAFWTSEVGTGEPLLGDAQSAPLAPLHLLALPLPPLRALTVAVAWQLLLALLLTHALLAALGTRPLGCVLGALVYAFSPFEVVWAYYPLGMTTAFFPGLALGLLLLRRGERFGLAGTLACGLGALTAGHPETAVQLAAACAALALVLAIRPAGVTRARFAAQLATAVVLLACLAAPVLLPALDALPESVRWRAATGPRTVGRLERFDPRAVAALVNPLRFGSPRDQNYAGPEGGSVNFQDLAGSYAGLVALAAALAGAALGVRWCLPLLAGGGLALAVALRLPPLYPIVAHLPGLRLAPVGRYRVVFVLAIAVAAGRAVGPLLASRRGRLLFAGALLLGALLLVALPPPASPWQTAWWAVTLGGAVAAGLVLVSGVETPLLGTLLVVALLADLWLLGYRYNPTLPGSLDLRPPAAIAAIAAESRGVGTPFRILGELDDLKPNLGALYGLWDPRGDDPMLPARPSLVVGRALHRNHYGGQPAYLVLREARPPLLDYLGVRFLLLRRRAHLPLPWREVWDEPGQSLWRNDQALALFFMPANVAVAAGEGEALSRVLLNPDFRQLAFLSRPLASLPATASGEVTRIAPRANGFDLEVSSPTGGLIASSVSFAPGWHARIDGEEVATCLVNAGFLAVPVAPGRHRVRLRYAPPHWPLALALAALGCVLLGYRAHRLVTSGARPPGPRAQTPSGSRPVAAGSL
jgi:hypothetical protein